MKIELGEYTQIASTKVKIPKGLTERIKNHFKPKCIKRGNYKWGTDESGFEIIESKIHERIDSKIIMNGASGRMVYEFIKKRVDEY